MQRRTVEQGVQARGVHADEPIRLGAAKRRLIQIVVSGHGLHGAEALTDGAFLHRGDPQTAYRLPALRRLIDQPEDQFALTSGIRCADDAGHAGIVH